MQRDIYSQRPAILRPAAVCRFLQCSRSTLNRRLESDPTFPRPVRLGANARAVGFLIDEVEAWLAARVAERDGAGRA
jgi:prophage regulatory protein